MDCFQDLNLEGVLLNGRYRATTPLNHGSFGVVYMARDLFTATDVALKCLKKPSAGLSPNSGIMVDDQSEELKLHSRIGHHPNIVNLINYFETDSHCYLVLEYCSMGDLYEAIRLDKGPKETEHVRSFMLQLVDAVECLHLKGIFHRDIKPENIFLTDCGSMKLGDFGLATNDTWSYEIAVGSDRYMAPEQYDPQGNGLSPAQADIWSIGICLLNILFSRNPFGVPADSDPLFADFVRDRQSLFDVFPNMSQDTYEVLVHCLAVDPEKRSLASAREALQRVISFTTDDESLDEFCTDTRDPTTATANREPLRTPSVASPQNDQVDAFPWSRALHMDSPQKRQLSAIRDNESEDLFPGSETSMQDWYSKTDTQSIDSVVDSGLGLSIGSTTLGGTQPSMKTKPMAIAGSLPSRGRSALSSIFGKKKAFESKSWSDMWDEDQEEEEREEVERSRKFSALPTRLSTLSQVDSESDGRSTPRAGLTELKSSNVNARDSHESFKSRDDGISDQTGFMFEEHAPAPRYSPPSKRSLLDKWSALGDRRRAPKESSKEASPAAEKRRFKPHSWRRKLDLTTNRTPLSRTTPDHGVFQQKQWNLSTDWRRSDHNLPEQKTRRPHASQLDGTSEISSDEAGEFSDDPEWVGGWNDLHL